MRRNVTSASSSLRTMTSSMLMWPVNADSASSSTFLHSKSLRTGSAFRCVPNEMSHSYIKALQCILMSPHLGHISTAAWWAIVCVMQEKSWEACAAQLYNAGLARHSPGGSLWQVRSQLRCKLALWLPMSKYNQGGKTRFSAQLKLYEACLYARNDEQRLFSMPSLGQQPCKLILPQYGFQHITNAQDCLYSHSMLMQLHIMRSLGTACSFGAW